MIRFNEKLLREGLKNIDKAPLIYCPRVNPPENPYHPLYYCGPGVYFGTYEILIFPLSQTVPYHPNRCFRFFFFFPLKLIVK